MAVDAQAFANASQPQQPLAQNGTGAVPNMSNSASQPAVHPLVQQQQQQATGNANPYGTPPQGWKGYNGMNWNDTNWYNAYSKAIQDGTNNSYNLGKYQQLAKEYGLKNYVGQTSPEAMQQMSINALKGDKNAQTYLNNMGYKPLTGDALWAGYDANKLNSADSATRWAYMNANPTADYTKNYEMHYYNQYANDYLNNKPMTDWERNYMNQISSKWGLQDPSNPLVQNEMRLQQDKQNALNAQDVQLNNSLQAADANNFQTMLKTQQDMSNRGIADSGLAADAYARATMAANQDYQKAYATAANDKATIAGNYDKEINTTAQDILTNKQQQQQQQFTNQLDQQKQQQAQDQFLTAQTGTIWMNGKQLTLNGQPITTLDWQKMSETQRHDMVTEQNTANANQNTAQKIANDYAIAKGNLQLNISKYNLQSQQAQASIANAKAQLDIAAQNAATNADKAKATALSKQLDVANSQALAWLKANPNKTLPKQYSDAIKSIGDQMNSINF